MQAEPMIAPGPTRRSQTRAELTISDEPRGRQARAAAAAEPAPRGRPRRPGAAPAAARACTRVVVHLGRGGEVGSREQLLPAAIAASVDQVNGVEPGLQLGRIHV